MNEQISVENSVIPTIKSFFQDVPRPVGYALSRVPYRYRPGIGLAYARNHRKIESFEKWDIGKQKSFVLFKLNEVLQRAMSIPFYRDIYAAHGMTSKNIGSRLM